MKPRPYSLDAAYALALEAYLADPQEATLEQAYELGRQAISRGLGVLDVIRLHQRAIECVAKPKGDKQGPAATSRSAHAFVLETLSPFEVTHRGFRATNLKLQHVVGTLEKRNRTLAAVNRQLELEIVRRKRIGKAMRQSERQSHRMAREAQRMEARLRRLSNQVLRAQEDERKRISRDLHDEVGQGLMAVSVALAGLQPVVARHGESTERRLTDVERLLQSTMETVHGFARELRPSMLDELGLLPTLHCHLKDFAHRTGLAVRLRGSPLIEKLDDDRKTVLYRVVQECLTNVARHAHASQVAVTLKKVGDTFVMAVKDDGRSFDPSSERSLKTGTRLGILGMQERVRLVRGRFALLARPGRGTTVRVVLPLRSLANRPRPTTGWSRKRPHRSSSLPRS